MTDDDDGNYRDFLQYNILNLIFFSHRIAPHCIDVPTILAETPLPIVPFIDVPTLLVEMEQPVANDGMRTASIQSPESQMVKFGKSNPILLSNIASLNPIDSRFTYNIKCEINLIDISKKISSRDYDNTEVIIDFVLKQKQ